MGNLALIGTVTLIHLLAVISPGPDFIMCVRNSLTYSRKTGVWTAFGFGLGIAVHVFYSLVGLALIISQSILIFNTIKLAGAAYLVYIGVKSILSKSSALDISQQEKKSDISSAQAIKIGFLTNILNPKVTLFFLSLFTFVVSPDTSLHISVIMGLIMVIDTILWFSLVATVLTQKHIRIVFQKFQGAFSKTLGGLLIALGIKLALTEK